MLGAPKDSPKEKKYAKTDTNPLSSADLFTFVNSVAWTAARLLPCICARSQRGIERIGSIIHHVHGGEREERCVAVQGDLQDCFSES